MHNNIYYKLFPKFFLITLVLGLCSCADQDSLQKPLTQDSVILTPEVDATEALKASLKNLPLIEIAAKGEEKDMFAVIISGDGGWTNIDRKLSASMASKGIATVGLNSLKYFWTKRTPDTAAQDLESIIRYYSLLWNKNKVILIGYSFGADTLPFMASRLSPELLGQVQFIALLGASPYATFEFHITDWLGDVIGFISLPDKNRATTTAKNKSADKTPKGTLPVKAEIEKMPQTKFLCIYGEQEKSSLCPSLDPSQAGVVRMKGGHHFDSNYKKLAEIIVGEIK